MIKKILVLCTGNSCRSQMVHAYLSFYGKNKLDVYSAGIEIHGLNLSAVEVLKKDDINISEYTSNHVDEYLDIDFDFILTVCDHAKENCPFIPSKSAIRLHHNFYDPSKSILTGIEQEKEFIKVRNQIKEYCKIFVNKRL